ncbi:MAG: PAS domain-containing sensor histidine kinase [SAR324 cluster bacterium]|nr:PAS domain-containing sensor histidine kinase [SAR324 cluster bacterium]
MSHKKSIVETAYQYLLDQAPVFFLLLDQKGRIIDANQYTFDLAGADIRQKMLKDVFVDFSELMNLDDLVKDPPRVHLLNVTTFTGLPQTFYFNFFDLGEQILVFGKLDVGEVETLRKDFLSLNHELNNLTRELHKKNTELEKLNALKNQFLGMAAHDLRKPISVIQAYSEFLVDEIASGLSEEHREFLDIIQMSSEFMSRLIDEFLDVSIIESGQFELNLLLHDLSSVIKKSLNLNNILAEKKQIKLLLMHEDGNGAGQEQFIMMDGPKIEQVINNLVSNAIEYSQPNTEVTIMVSSYDDRLKVAVRDEGVGISPDETERLFKPFGRTSAKKTSGEKSTGLGLAIARKIIEAHRGTIDVESEIGKGSTFFFSIPKNN